MRRILMVGLSSVGLLVAPVAAQAADRMPAPVEESDAMFGETPAIGWILALLVAAGTIAVIASDDDDSDVPVSP